MFIWAFLIVLVEFTSLTKVMGLCLVIALVDLLRAHELLSCFGFDVMKSLICLSMLYLDDRGVLIMCSIVLYIVLT